MNKQTGSPRIRNVVLDCENPRQLAEFYRQMFGLAYRPGDEPPPHGQPDPRGEDWLVLRNHDGVGLAFQKTDDFQPSTWPDGEVPQQVHLDTSVPTAEAFEEQCARAVGLGASLRYDRSDDPEEALRVYADPAGHPFCIIVMPT